MSKLTKFSSVKAVGLLLLTSAFGIATVGFVRYNATASELLPRLSIARSILGQETAAQQWHLFSMEVVGGQSHYQTFETEIANRNGEIKTVLRIQKTDQSFIREYEKVLDLGTFNSFWAALRELDVAELTNLSPSSEKIGATVNTPIRRTATPATYRFKFQDGVHDYPNSFQVYSPETLTDTRYQQLQELTESFGVEIFGDRMIN